MLSLFSSPLLLVFLLLPANLLGRPNGGDLLASVNQEGTEDYEVSNVMQPLTFQILTITSWSTKSRSPHS